MQLRREGSDVPVSVLVSAFPIRYEGDKQVVLTLEDVSDVVRLKEEVSQAEQALRESEALYRSLFTLAPSGVVLLGEEGRILAFNDQAHEQLGYTRGEYSGLRLADLHPPEQRAPVSAWMALVFETSGAEVECRHRAKSGEIRDILCRSRPVEIGGRRRLLSVFEHITHRARVGEELRASEARFRAIFEQAAVGVAQGETRTGRYVRVNDKFCAIVGYSREEILARSWQDFTHPDDLQQALASVSRMVASHEPYSKQKRYVRKDGSIVWVDLTVSPMWTAGEEPIFQIAVIEDVTARKRAEDELNRSEARFRALIERATDMIVVLDAGGRIQFWSPSATEVLGWTAAEVLGRSGAEFIHADDLQRVMAVVRASSVEQGPTPRITVRCRHKDGSWRLLEGLGRNLLHDPVVRGVVVNTRDVTEQRRLEEQFQQAQKLESIGRLAGGVFVVFFPRTSEPAEEGAAPPAPVKVTRGTETVLVVEDDPQVRVVTVRSLGSGGYRVLVAGSGAEALEIAARERGGVDLLVTDVIMPGLDGRALADELHRHHPELRVLYVSGHAEEVIATRGVLEPGTEFLPKPFTERSSWRGCGRSSTPARGR